MPNRKPAPKKRIRSLSCAALTAFSLLAGCSAAPLAELPAEALSFALLGDTPYSEDEARRLDRLIDDLNRRGLAFAVHVGDIGTTRQACRDDWLAARKAQFGRIRAPFVLLPGDNEWSDCHNVGADPMVRLRKWREAFCFREGMKVERQPGEYCEHVRWRLGGTLFVALNVPGHDNNARAPAEAAARMKAVFAWLDEAEELAPPRLVILMQANPFLPYPALSPLRDRLAGLGSRWPGRVVLVHGDTHVYQDDEPLRGLRRIEVWGAPWVSWLRGAVVGDRLVVEPGPLY